jgi:hypothetical protein
MVVAEINDIIKSHFGLNWKRIQWFILKTILIPITIKILLKIHWNIIACYKMRIFKNDLS